MGKSNFKFDNDILALRARIDEIDGQILSLLDQRQTQVEKVVKLKKYTISRFTIQPEKKI